jgi:hypothetical protein
MKRKRIGTRSYYMMKQVDNEDMDICEGCCFLPAREAGSKCPEYSSELVMCQEWETNEEGDWPTDYIFVPATKQGLADYVAHRLEQA